MIGKGERLVLTGRADALYIRLESLNEDGMKANRHISRAISWELLAQAIVDILSQTVGAMREQLQRCPQCGNPLVAHKLDCGFRGNWADYEHLPPWPQEPTP